jgi:hypothetical protein
MKVIDSFSDGTACDLSDQPRSTNLVYECGEVPSEQVYSVEEVSTCKYKIVLKTPKLCMEQPSLRIVCFIDIPGQNPTFKSPLYSTSAQPTPPKPSKSKSPSEGKVKKTDYDHQNLKHQSAASEAAELSTMRGKLAEEILKLTSMVRTIDNTLRLY